MKIHIKIIAVFVVLAGFFFYTAKTFAHGDATNQNKDVGAYNIEFEYDDKGPVYALEAYNYEFYLLNKTTKEKVEVDSVSAVFTKKDGTLVLGASLKGNQVIGSNGKIAAVMPEAGDYNAALVFFKGDTALAKADFNFTVVAADGSAASSTSPKAGSSMWIVIAGLAGLTLGFLVGKKGK